MKEFHRHNIADELARGNNRSRHNPLIVAVPRRDIINPKDEFVDLSDILTADIQIARWRQGVSRVSVLAGQHRIGAAGQALASVKKDLIALKTEIQTLDATILQREQKIALMNDNPKTQQDDLDYHNGALSKLRKLQSKNNLNNTELSERLHALLFWPAIVYDKGTFPLLLSILDLTTIPRHP